MYYIHIPLLVQEKLDYYEWKKRLNILHKEYYQIVHRYDFSDPYDFVVVYYPYVGKKGTYRTSDFTYHRISADYSSSARFIRRRDIINFTKTYREVIAKLPSKYNFSSGLEQINGGEFQSIAGYHLSQAQIFQKQLDREHRKRTVLKMITDASGIPQLAIIPLIIIGVCMAYLST